MLHIATRSIPSAFGLALILAISAPADPRAGAAHPDRWMEAEQKIRQIRPTLASPIPSQVLPSDDIVYILSRWAIADVVDFSHETRAQTIERLARDEDGIAVVEIDRITPRLVEDDTWVRTTFEGTVKEVIKNPFLFGNGRFQGHYDSGVMKVKGVEVRAGAYPLLKRGSRCLVFLSGGAERWIGYIFDVTDTRRVLQPAFGGHVRVDASNPFSGMSLADALRELRKTTAAERQPRVRQVTVTAAIPNLLEPADEVVVLKKAEVSHVDYVYYGNETPQQEIARHVAEDDGIALVEVLAVDGALIDGDKWIRTTVTAAARNIIKNPSLFTNGRIELLFEGGVTRVNDVEIRAGDYPILHVGAQYLVFITTNGADNWLGYIFDVTNPRQLTRPRFANIDPQNSPNPFRGMSWAEAEREMKKSLPK